MTSIPSGYTLTDHVIHALSASVIAVITATPPERQAAAREEFAEYIEQLTAGTHPTAVLVSSFDVGRVTRGRKGKTGKTRRPDHRSLLAVVHLVDLAYDPPSPVELVRVPARKLVDQAGRPIDTEQTLRDILDQFRPAPDDLSGLDGPPSTGEAGR